MARFCHHIALAVAMARTPGCYSGTRILAEEHDAYAVLGEGVGAFALQMLPGDRLAMGTYGAGVRVYDPRHFGSATQAVLNVGSSGSALTILPDGCLAVGGDGVRIFNITAGISGIHGGGPAMLPGAAVNALLHVPGVGLVVGSDTGLYVLAGDLCCWTPGSSTPALPRTNLSRPEPQPGDLLRDRFIYSLVRVSNDLVAAGTDAGVLLLAASQLRHGAAPLLSLASGRSVFSLLLLPDGGLAAGTNNGTLLFDASSLQLGGSPRAVLAQGSTTWALLLLAGGALLLGTDGDAGALVLPPSEQVLGGRASASLSGGSIVWSLAAVGKGRIAVGTSDGVQLFNVESLGGLGGDHRDYHRAQPADVGGADS
mmetsp:Transcript_10412/g.21035  ORF Transcript_10412/g.21035 Transcript_10412/m.21035 type:complete len:369 (-) Transcript_10412:129-1235(-)